MAEDHEQNSIEAKIKRIERQISKERNYTVKRQRVEQKRQEMNYQHQARLSFGRQAGYAPWKFFTNDEEKILYEMEKEADKDV